MRHAVPPSELYDIEYTVAQDGKIMLTVYSCRMCKSLVRDEGRGHHRKYHEDTAEMLNEREVAGNVPY